MPIRTRDRYLRALAAEPFFRDVPRHLIAVVGRRVDPVALGAGATMPFDPAREAMLVSDGHVVVTDGNGHAVAAVGPLGVIAAGDAGSRSPVRIVATSPVRGFVVPRRELEGLATMAPRVGTALAEATAHQCPDTTSRPARSRAVSSVGSARASVRASRS